MQLKGGGEGMERERDGIVLRWPSHFNTYDVVFYLQVMGGYDFPGSSSVSEFST